MKKLSIIERINTLEDIFKISKPSKEEKLLISYKGKKSRLLGAQAMLVAEMIAEVYNEGIILDWNEASQTKWFGRYDYSKLGSGFDPLDFIYWYSESSVSSRLHFKKEALFLDAVKKFPEIYKRLMEKH